MFSNCLWVIIMALDRVGNMLMKMCPFLRRCQIRQKESIPMLLKSYIDANNDGRINRFYRKRNE